MPLYRKYTEFTKEVNSIFDSYQNKEDDKWRARQEEEVGTIIIEDNAQLENNEIMQTCNLIIDERNDNSQR